MTYTCSYSYFACSSCAEKTHCEKCGADIADTLCTIAGVQSVEMNVPARTLTVTGTAFDTDELEERLEENGVFVE